MTVSLIGLILFAHHETLLSIRPLGVAGMLTLVLAALVIGWVLGMPGRGIRTATAVTTAGRNVGVGLVIAVSSFPGTAAVSATVAVAVFQTITVAFLALGWGRMASVTPTEPTRPTRLQINHSAARHLTSSVWRTPTPYNVHAD